MPILIVAFAAGAYGFGSLLRGSNVIVNEAAIVRGAPGATEGLAQAYLGVFSPTRASYQLRFPGGALLSSPTNGDFLGDGTAAGLDVLQGDPSQRPGPGRRLRVAADDPRGERRGRATRPGRSSGSRTGTSGAP